jgi:hypothetical protein
VENYGWIFRDEFSVGCKVLDPMGPHGPMPPLDLENSRGKNTKTREIYK